MKIDYQWGKPPKTHRSVAKWFKRVFSHKPVPLCHSNHYRRESFHPEDNPQHKLF